MIAISRPSPPSSPTLCTTIIYVIVVIVGISPSLGTIILATVTAVATMPSIASIVLVSVTRTVPATIPTDFHHDIYADCKLSCHNSSLEDALLGCGVSDSIALSPRETGKAWDETMISSFRMKQADVERAMQMASKINDETLKVKVVLLANSMELAADAGQVVMLLSAERRDQRKCSKEHVATLTQLRRRLGMMKHTILIDTESDELAKYDAEATLALPFKVSIVVNKIYQDATKVVSDMVALWVSDVDSLIQRQTEITPNWQPVRENLLSSHHAIGLELMSCQEFTTMNVISGTLGEYGKNLKALNLDGHGAVVPANVLKKVADAKDLGVDTVCTAFALATWHTSIKVEKNAMHCASKITYLKDQIALRGSTLTAEMTQALDMATKADFKAEGAATDEENQRADEAGAGSGSGAKRRRTRG